jgi:Fur family ferric uptake transcriptional regulator
LTLRQSRDILAIKSHMIPSDTLLSDKNIRKTESRSAVLSVLSSVRMPLTADDVISELGRRNQVFHKATIYRDLAVFVKLGVIREFHFPRKLASYYELIRNDSTYNFVCRACSAITPVCFRGAEKNIVSIEDHLRTRGFKPMNHTLKFFGLCPQCVKKGASV